MRPFLPPARSSAAVPRSLAAALVAILAVFLARLNPDETKAVAYLLRGEVAAPFEAREIGMAERTAMRAVGYNTP